MIDFGLQPCPMCGGEAEVARLIQDHDSESAVIKCTGCGLSLEWETEIKVSVSRSGKRTRARAGMNAIEAWNRRCMCDTCGAKKLAEHAERVAALPNCNDCGHRGDCGHVPKTGEMVRINCPLWAPMPKVISSRSCRTCHHASFCKHYDHDGSPTDCIHWEPLEE